MQKLSDEEKDQERTKKKMTKLKANSAVVVTSSRRSSPDDSADKVVVVHPSSVEVSQLFPCDTSSHHFSPLHSFQVVLSPVRDSSNGRQLSVENGVIRGSQPLPIHDLLATLNAGQEQLSAVSSAFQRPSPSQNSQRFLTPIEGTSAQTENADEDGLNARLTMMMAQQILLNQLRKGQQDQSQPQPEIQMQKFVEELMRQQVTTSSNSNSNEVRFA